MKMGTNELQKKFKLQKKILKKNDRLYVEEALENLVAFVAYKWKELKL